MSKNADTAYPIHNTLAVRFSPYAFSGRPVPARALASVFEAARWAPSSYNEQPWRYIVGVRGRGGTHGRILDCLVEGNRAWAQNAPVLALGVVMHRFVSSGKPNPAAEHDLGLATANLVTQATTCGLHVHQMIGLDAEAAATAFEVPADQAKVLTALAIGYRERTPHMNGALAERDRSARSRRPQSDFVFGERFGDAANF